MEKYQVSARKYRPSSFDTVVGQHALTGTLKNAIKSGRLAHAYLFCGPRGVGKTTCARIFAKTINCEHLTADGEACNECESCRAFNEQRSYNVSELDAASNNGVDEMRDLVEKVKIPPQVGKYKVYIIDEVHMLSSSAFNAFLKTLEEPPSYAIFILATTEKHKIIPTILSRCQTYDFSRITVNDIIYQLRKVAESENITAEPEALNIIAQKADGAMRDALSIFDQVAASSGGNITYRAAIDNLNVLDYDYYFRLTDLIAAGDVPGTLLTFQEIRNQGFDAQFFINGLGSHFRNLVAAFAPATLKLLEMAEEIIPRYQEQVKKTPLWFLYRAMDLCGKCDLDYRTATNKQFLVELTLIKLCQLLKPTPPPDGAQRDGGTPHLASMAGATGASAQGASAGAPKATASELEAQQRAEEQKRQAERQAVARAAAAAIAEGLNAAAGRPHVQVPTEQGDKPLPDAPKTISISGYNNAATDNEKVVEKAPTVEKREPFTADEFVNASFLYARNFPNEAFLINALTNAIVTVGDDFAVKLLVDNVAQQSSVMGRITEIVGFYRETLNNTRLTINVDIKPYTKKLKVLSPEEIAADMMIKNDDMRELVQRFRLGIS